MERRGFNTVQESVTSSNFGIPSASHTLAIHSSRINPTNRLSGSCECGGYDHLEWAVIMLSKDQSLAGLHASEKVVLYTTTESF